MSSSLISKLLILVFVAAAGGLGFLFAGSQAENKKLQQEVVDLRQKIEKLQGDAQKLAETVHVDEEKLQQNTQQKGQLARDAEIAMENLRAQYAAQYKKMQEELQKFEDLKTRQKGVDFATIQTQIKTNQATLRGLENKIKEIQSDDKSLKQESQQTLNKHKDDFRTQNERLNENLKAVEFSLKDVQGQIAFWRKRKGDINQTNKLNELDGKLAELRSQQQVLRSTKLELGAREKEVTGKVHQEVSEEKEDLQDASAQIRAQVTQVNAEIARLQGLLQNSQRTNTDYAELLRRAQSSYELERTKVQALEAQVKQKQQELSALRH